ncbi:MAG: S8 family serine peptidase [Candidatus Heimdallarchaeota archaeon]
MDYSFKGMRIAIILSLLFFSSNFFSTSLITTHDTSPDSIFPDTSKERKIPLDKERAIDTNNWSYSNIDYEKKVLVSKFFRSENAINPLPKSLGEMMSKIPSDLWKTSRVTLILSLESKNSNTKSLLTEFNPQYLQRLPMAIVETTLDSVDHIKSIPGISGVFLDTLVYMPEADIRSPNSIHLEKVSTYPSKSIIGARYLQDLGINGSGVTIAILDTGIDRYHPDLDDLDDDDATYDPKIILEASFIDYDDDGSNDTSPLDDNNHGTHVAGIAAGNGLLKGVAPGATLMNAKVLDGRFGSGFTSWIVKGMDWAILNGADIISMSLGGFGGDASLLYSVAAEAAWQNGTILVAAAGNSGPTPGTISSPGLESRTVTVGASNIYNDVSLFSSRGPSSVGTVDPDIIAPGRGILSLEKGGGYLISSGTSMAAPAISGVIALLKSGAPGATNDEIRSALLSTASDVGRHVFAQGAGMADAKAAYELLQSGVQEVYAFPSFPSSQPLVLSPGEKYEYQLDVFLNQTFGSLNVTPSNSIKTYANVSLIDAGQDGWIRAIVNVTGPPINTDGILLINDGNQNYFNALLSFHVDIAGNDANSGTDAGDTLAGALALNLGTVVHGEAFQWDKDLYTIPVIQGQVYFVELFNMTKNLNLYLADETGNIFNLSTSSGTIPDAVMFEAHSTGDYFIRIEGNMPGKYSLFARNATGSELLSFQPAYLTGNIWSHSMDRDSNGLNDELLFHIEINVLQTGKYNIWYSVAQNRSDYYFGRYVFMWDYLNLTLREGIQNLTISVPGGLLESSGFDGSYVINELAFGRDDFSLLYFYDSEVFSTPFLDHSSYDPLTNNLRSFSITEKDIDGEGGPEKIVVNLEVYFSKPGGYSVVIPIFNENQNDILAVNGSAIFVSRPGITNITIEFIAQQFSKNSNIVVFGVTGSWFGRIIPVYSRISKQALNSFDSVLTYSVTDYAINTNENIINDTIRFTFAVTSKIKTTAFFFTGHPYSVPDETMILINNGEENRTLVRGSNVVYIDFDMRILRTKLLHAPYFFPNLGISLPNDQGVFKTPYFTRNYQISGIEKTPVRFSSTYEATRYEVGSDAGVRVDWDIYTLAIDSVVFEIEIWGYEQIQGDFKKTITFIRDVFPGTSTVSFRLSAEDLYQSRYIGGLEIYSASIYSLLFRNKLQQRFQSHNLSLLDFGFHVGFLPSTDYRDYEDFVQIFFEKPPMVIFEDSNTDNLYDSLIVNGTAVIQRPQNYSIELDLFSKNDYFTPNVTDQFYRILTRGEKYNFSFVFTAETLVRAGFDGIVYGNMSIKNTNTSYLIEYKIPNFPFNKSQFDFTTPVLFESIASDRAFNLGNDGDYDGVQIDLNLNFTLSGKYGLVVGLFAQIPNSFESYLGNVTLSNRSYQQGLSNVSITVPYYYLLSIFKKAEDLYIKPEIVILVVPLFAVDNKGLLLISDHPMFLNNVYDLSRFNMVPPFSFGSVKIVEKDENGDNLVDSVNADVTILVNDPLAFSLKARLSFFWQDKSKSLVNGSDFSPSGKGVLQTTVPFTIVEIFSSSRAPLKYLVEGSLKIVTFDGITVANYVTPVQIQFEEVIPPPPPPTTSTFDKVPPLGDLGALLLIILVITVSGTLIAILGRRFLLARR